MSRMYQMYPFRTVYALCLIAAECGSGNFEDVDKDCVNLVLDDIGIDSDLRAQLRVDVWACFGVIDWTKTKKVRRARCRKIASMFCKQEEVE